MVGWLVVEGGCRSEKDKCMRNFFLLRLDSS